MQLLWCDTRAGFDSLAADRLAAVLARKPDAVLALPTGQTPLGLYAAVRLRAAAGEVSFAAARVFDLDEYAGLGATHPLSYASYFRAQLLEAVGAPDCNIRLLRGDAADLAAECRDYDAAIARAGGIDLAILGLGTNGHIAFNEPGADWESGTHLVQLSPQTREINARQQGRQTVLPEFGVTMGIATLRQAREIVLLAAGAAKRAALEALRRGVPDPHWPVTSLIGHPRLTVISEAQLGEP
ncbi:MAG: glucosamine-6-phosphate deaminase [Steroidobacterales bacterium]|jgi:glucosamine-6-phosphate deaminase